MGVFLSLVFLTIQLKFMFPITKVRSNSISSSVKCICSNSTVLRSNSTFCSNHTRNVYYILQAKEMGVKRKYNVKRKEREMGTKQLVKREACAAVFIEGGGLETQRPLTRPLTAMPH